MATSTCLALPILAGVAAGAVSVGAMPIPGPDADPMTMFGPGLLAGLTAIQFAAMLLPAGVLAMLLPIGERGLWARVTASFPFHVGPLGYLLAAAILGATGGALPSWAVDQLSRATGWEMGIVGVIEGLNHAELPARIAMIAVVVGLAPVAEELIFRGFLWAAIEQSAAPLVAWLGTSLLFSAYHLDPLQVLAVLPLGLLMGWLRWRTGSLWAPLVLHVVNNGLALLATMAFPDLLTGLAPSLACAAVAAITLGSAWTLEGRPASPS